MSPDLRTALRDLAPEPPDDLGRPETAHRRARAIRRRRYAAATVTSVVALLLAGAAFLPERRALPPTTPAPRVVFPDWPRRGDAPAEVERAAVAAYLDSLPNGVEQWRDPRVLYASDAVVLLHATASPGGERLVVVTKEAEGYAVYSDEPAPGPDTHAVAVLLDRPALTESPCVDGVAGRGAVRPSRALVVTRPGVAEVGVRAQPLGCRSRPPSGPRQVVPLAGGAGLTTVDAGPKDSLLLDGADIALAVVVDRASHRPVYRSPQVAAGERPTGWAMRTDGSRASATSWPLAALTGQAGPCATLAAFSLPDGTPVRFCAGAEAGSRAVLAAEGPDRRPLAYLDAPHGPDTVGHAAIVDGLDGRWLVFVGSAELTAAELAGGPARTPVEVSAGIGWLRLGTDPLPEEVVLTIDGSVPIDRDGGTPLP